MTKSPVFTKKHFEIIATHLREHGGSTNVYELSKLFAALNPQFRADLFIARSTVSYHA